MARRSVWHQLLTVTIDAGMKRHKQKQQEALAAAHHRRQQNELEATNQWVLGTLAKMDAAHDAASFQTAASALFSMMAYEETNGWPMTPRIPELVSYLAETGGRVGTENPAAQPRIMWCMDELAKLAAQTYAKAPPHVAAWLSTVEEHYLPPLTWEDRPPGLRKAAEIIAWHKLNGVPMKPYNPPNHTSPELLMARARAEGRA